MEAEQNGSWQLAKQPLLWGLNSSLKFAAVLVHNKEAGTGLTRLSPPETLFLAPNDDLEPLGDLIKCKTRLITDLEPLNFALSLLLSVLPLSILRLLSSWRR